MTRASHTASFWTPGFSGRVRCHLCAHQCRIRPGKSGNCRVRHNADGELVSLVHGRLISTNPDPIEKKPLSHFHPGSLSFSVATVGCNLRCAFCQNASISQWRGGAGGIPPGEHFEPSEVVELAVRCGCRSISFTYTEPTLGLEFAAETGRIARGQGIGNVFVTNGFMTEAAVRELAGFLDAANVDLKSMRERTYRRTCRARLAPVLRTIEQMVTAGIWVEVTTLVVPGLNDSDEELADIARFIVGVGARIPWHISAFHPTYRMTDRARTPIERLQRAYEIGREAGLKYVYVGNVRGDRGESTYCSNCGRRLIQRYGYTLQSVDLDGEQCPGCGTVLDGVGIAGARPDGGGGPRGLGELFHRRR